MVGGLPGGAGAPPPVPVTRSNNNGCLLWGLAGCGALILLGIGAIVLMGWYVSRNPEVKNLTRNITTAPGCSQSLGQISQALHAYRRDHKGKYPAKLEDLVPKYMDAQVTDGCGGALSEMGERLQYTPAASTAQGDAPIVSVHLGNTSVLPTQQQTLYVRLLQDGRVVMDQVTRAELLRPPPAASP